MSRPSIFDTVEGRLNLPFLPHQNRADLVMGRLWRFPISPLVRVTASARTAHLYVIGMSGKGKSKLLEWCLYQDIATGRGCGLIDPHSLLVDDLPRPLITQCFPGDPVFCAIGKRYSDQSDWSSFCFFPLPQAYHLACGLQ